jgi:hypothetical protein
MERMNQHIAIGLTVLGVMLAGAAWRRWKRRSHAVLPCVAARPDTPVEELLTPSGRFKAVAFEHDGRAYRVEVFELVGNGQEDGYWRRVAGSSFADGVRLGAVLQDNLRAASGESFGE